MKTSLLPALLALAAGIVTPRLAAPAIARNLVAVPAAVAASPEPLAAPATVIAIPPTARASIVAIDAPVPADVKIEVRRDGAEGVVISVRRKDHVVTLRRGDARVVAAEQAQIRIHRGEEGDAPLIWETTAPGSLATTRGLVVLAPPADASSRAGTLPSAVLRLAAAPVALARDAGPRHACVAEDDGLGGFTVLCRVDAFASAASLTGSTPREGITLVGGDHPLVRVDLPAPEAGVSAALVGYTDGFNGIVIRAEASRVPGEDRASITVVSAARPQPVAPRPRRWMHRWPEPDFAF